MTETAKRLGNKLSEGLTELQSLRAKCVSVMIFEKDGKTVVQPLAEKKEISLLHDLFHHNSLEVWLPSGYSNVHEFDVSILKYKPLLQGKTKCTKAKNRVCIKNYFDTIVSCRQCPLNHGGGRD
jgi:hypothetical protein